MAMKQLPSFLRPAARRGPRYSVRPFCVTLLVFTVLATVSWVLSERGHPSVQIPYSAQRGTPAAGSLFKREEESECRLVRTAKDQCAFVRSNCPDHEDGLFSYLQLYYCSLADAKPLAFIILIFWLSVLFTTIGIAASDFLCIDLSTLASILGMSESLTGVTFLAFGNGSPDVFSTFAAMRSNSGSLAIGELIGAASFITSVVAGSMALIRPFKVARRSFVRDVGFFVIAVSFTMILLADGKLHVWESAAMVGLYAFYVVMVVTWHWYLVRKRRKYERDVAARTHFHIPANQELEIEEAIEDDEPGMAPESRSLLHGASTEDFDLLERAEGTPIWKEEDDEDDETRNRFLAEIRDNMHVYRPSGPSRRNTLNPIRPSLVGALEFQSVLHSLKKSKNIYHNPAVSISSYSDDDETSSQPFDTRSVASHPRTCRPSAPDRLSPLSAAGSSRVRAVSANDADGLRLDTSLLDRRPEQTPRLTVRRPSNEHTEDQEAVRPPQPPRIDTSVMLTTSPSSLEPSSSLSPAAAQPPDLLAPPNSLNSFHSPNYQTSTAHSHSPLPVSPRGSGNHETVLDDPSAPFPAYTDMPPSPSSRPPSIRLPNPAASPAERLQFHDSLDDSVHENGSVRKSLSKLWPNSVLPSPRQLGCTLFPTLAGWKSKNIWEWMLGLVAAPSVLLLTLTIPVVEPQGESAETDPIPSVVIEQFSDGNNQAPKVRLPADSPILHSLDHGPASELPPSHPHHKSSEQESRSRPRWDSELPAAPPTCEPSEVVPAKDWNRWLVAIQLFTGPFFVVLIGWTTADETRSLRNLLLPSLISLLFSFVCLTVLIIGTRRPWHHRHGISEPQVLPRRKLPAAWRPFLSLLGFLVAISWIATIATEVVALLKTLGVILNISDSLLGLTIFAVGNSLGDLVADITVARLGYPVMALSACFGGPMLNILLGIGLGGLYMTMNGGKKQQTPGAMGHVSPAKATYEIAISKVLVISGATLLVVLVGLLIVVPMNNWRMDRKIGWGLMAVWCVSTLGNVIAEVVT
ncbi:Sodium/calcium exchanger membrane region [Penicillium riverlandense]|uniref:Sodium/calcium exchanger membrane region n=1 Tax=Penicillium riverlandense TaxID=1903569 RepID=UPI002549130F|nr:Sodium/calcium exchanger membrane region [Penicillium riverlandense]KAJ5825791.1 Sodium/calcium exchanger membrane region [Penicillium riverlandense]